MAFFKEFSYMKDTKVRIIDNGKIEMTCVDEVKGVTPRMMLWYFLNRTKERYQMWHPTHIDFQVLSQPIDGGVGSIYYIKEQMEGGPMIDTVAEVIEADLDETKAVLREKFRQTEFPLMVYHRMEVMPGGTRIFSNLTLGSDNKRQNAQLLKKTGIMTEKGYKVVFTHVQEEGKNFEKFLPKLFEENADARWKGK